MKYLRRMVFVYYRSRFGRPQNTEGWMLYNTSTLLYPSLCWTDWTVWWPLIRGSVFFEQLPRSYLADFCQFSLQKAHATYIAEAEEKNWCPKFIFTPSYRVVFKGRCHFSIKGHFPKLRAAPQFWKTGWYRVVIKRRCNSSQGNGKELLFEYWEAALNSGKNDHPWK